ncbi:DUF3099 domain-containing protein [Corynebacterium sp. ES2794-CONJ1]|uniref:DUF3099 domain-containing protein n=1 Tax=unclassified Corynebacterium TaxID=2624378 RepID=UPI0021681389|nr:MULTISPECIES: DUF3099 domain-containing protein [unclassified Corynebacterium]MCS4491004.1 DUF3099 domain-containing protein [Corynebacterium sp. ES2715-CONJ3]MCU9518482.1 DUF3099 domain-containing protein [Corynebacterium sp. ES2794-CONJ1]
MEQDKRDTSHTGAAPDSSPTIIDATSRPLSAQRMSQRIWWPGRRKKAALITSARQSPAENRKQRERQYAIIQAIRLPFLALAAFSYLYLELVWFSAVLFVISVPLPWIAVVIANGVGQPRDPRERSVYKPALARQQLSHNSRPGPAAIDSGDTN